MYLGIDRVPDATWTLINAHFTGDSDGSQLTNAQPKDVTRIQCDVGSIGSYTGIALQSVWATARVPRIACLVGLTVRAGLPARIKGMPASDPSEWELDLGGNSQSAVTCSLPDGSVGVWWMFDADLPAIVGVSIELENSETDSPFVPGAYIDIGEAGIWRGVLVGDVGIDDDWQDGSRESTELRAIDDTAWPVPFVAGRFLQTSASGIAWEFVYGSGSTPNLSTLRNRCQRGEVVAVVHRYRDAAGDLSSEVLAAHAFLGGGRKWGEFRHQGGNNYATTIRFDEYPAKPQP